MEAARLTDSAEGCRLRHRGNSANGSTFGPGDIGRDDQRGNLSRRGARSNDGFGGVAPYLGRSRRCAQPLGIGPRNRFDVGGQRRIVAQVISRVLADNVYDRHLRSARVVEIRNTVRQTGAQMQQRARRLFSHPRVAVRGSRHHTFKKAEHATHFRYTVKRADDVHL